MCVSCGCGQVNDNHGDRRNITLDNIKSAAQAANMDEQTVAQNIQQGVSQSQGRAGGQQFQMGGQGMGQGYGSQPGMGPGFGAQQKRMGQGFGDPGDFDQLDLGRDPGEEDF